MKLGKYIFLALAFVGSIYLSGCDKLSDLLKADVYITLPIDITIPLSGEGDMISIDEWVTTVNLDEEITKVNNQLGEENIKSVSLYSAQLIIPNELRAGAMNLSHLSNVIVYFQSDALREWKNVASWTGPIEGDYLQALNINSSQDWIEYFNSTTRYLLKFQCQAHKPITEPINVKGQVKFLVKVSA